MALDKDYWDRLASYRGLSALFVALGHMVQVFVSPISTGMAPYTGLLAQASVMIFFVVSGCSIAASAHRAIQTSHPVRQFTLNRLGRILPPLLLAIGLMWLLSVLAPYLFSNGTHAFLVQPNLPRDGYFFNWGEIVGAVTFCNGFWSSTPSVNGPLWSLSFEVWLYVIYFSLLLAVKQRHYVLFFCSIALFAVLVHKDMTGANFYFLKYSLIWIAGVMLFFYRLRQQVPRALSKQQLFILLSVMVALTIYFAYCFVVSNMTYDIARFNVSFGLTFALYSALSRSKFPNLIVTVSKLASRFGYTLYLIHFPIYLFVLGISQEYLLDNHNMTWPIGLATMAFSIVLAFFASKIVERRELFVGKAKQ